MAFSTLAIADSRSERFTGTNLAAWKAWPTMGMRNSDSLAMMETRRGIEPTTAGASAALVWFATNRQTPAGMFSRPSTRMRTPIRRTMNNTPPMPARYSGAGGPVGTLERMDGGGRNQGAAP